MRVRVASSLKATLFVTAVAAGAIAGTAPFEPAEAKPKLRPIPVGAAAATAARGPQSASASDQQVAAADGQEKSQDPLSKLNVSERTKALQERADRILAENGESRRDEADVDSAFATGPDVKPLQPSKTKELAAGIKCIAGCD